MANLSSADLVPENYPLPCSTHRINCALAWFLLENTTTFIWAELSCSVAHPGQEIWGCLGPCLCIPVGRDGTCADNLVTWILLFPRFLKLQHNDLHGLQHLTCVLSIKTYNFKIETNACSQCFFYNESCNMNVNVAAVWTYKCYWDLCKLEPISQ